MLSLVDGEKARKSPTTRIWACPQRIDVGNAANPAQACPKNAKFLMKYNFGLFFSPFEGMRAAVTNL